MKDASQIQPVTVSLQDLIDGSVSFDTLTEAFGPSSLGIIIVKDLDARFQQLRAEVLSGASYLAALSEEELETLTIPESKYLVGWSCGKETLRSGHFDTLKGSYYINCAFYQDGSLQSAPADPVNFPGLSEYTTDNVWPCAERLPRFRGCVEELCRVVIDTAALVARACDRFAVANEAIEGYPDGYLERVVRESLTTKARLLHYFPPELGSHASSDTSQEDDDDESDDDWCATHVDHGCLTGLTSAMFVDEAATVTTTTTTTPSSSPLPELPTSPDPHAGLYIRSRTNQVVKVNIPKDCLAFQTGEALQLITRGQFRAVPHFVKGVKSAASPGTGTGGTGGAGMRVARNTLAVFTQPNLGEVVDVEGTVFGDFARGVVARTY